MDLGNCILAVIGFFLHIEGAYYRHAKAIFCINSVVFCIRIMDIYTVNSRLGPKMVMIKRMVCCFLLIVLNFLGQLIHRKGSISLGIIFNVYRAIKGCKLIIW